MNSTLTREILEGVDRLFEDPARWTSKSFTRDANDRRIGFGIRIFSKRACKFCCYAAIRVVARRIVGSRWKSLSATKGVLKHLRPFVLARGYYDVATLNDEGGYLVMREVIKQGLATA